MSRDRVEQLPAERRDRLVRLPGETRDLEPEVGEPLAHPGEQGSLHLGEHGASGRDLRVHRGMDRGRPPAVHAADHRLPLLPGELRDFGEGRRGAVGPPDPHRGHALDARPLRARIAEDHPDLVAAALDPLHLFAVERLPQLAAELRGPDPDSGPARAGAEDELGSPLFEVVRNQDHARVLPQPGLQHAHRSAQVRAGAAADADRDIPGLPQDGSHDGEVRAAAKRADLRAQPIRDPAGRRRGPLPGRPEFPVELADGRPGAGRIPAEHPSRPRREPFPDEHREAPVDPLSGLRLDLVPNPADRRLDPLDHPSRRGARGAGRQRHLDDHEVPIEGRRRVHGHPSAAHEAGGERQPEDAAGQGGAPMVEGEPERGEIDGADDRLETPLDGGPETRQARTRTHPEAAVRQVVGQDPGGLDQREREDREDDPGERPDELPPDAGEAEQRRKRRHGGQDAEDHRHQHLPDAPHRRRCGRALSALDTPLDILPDDDRVVHDDAQREDEGEQADHVHADGKSGHEQEGAEEGHREPRGGPHREPAREREEQHQEDQGEPREAVPDEHRHPAFKEPPTVEPGRHREALGERKVPDEVEDGVRGVEQPGARRQGHRQEDRRLAVEARLEVLVAEAVGDGGEIPDRDHPRHPARRSPAGARSRPRGRPPRRCAAAPPAPRRRCVRPECPPSRGGWPPPPARNPARTGGGPLPGPRSRSRGRAPLRARPQPRPAQPRPAPRRGGPPPAGCARPRGRGQRAAGGTAPGRLPRSLAAPPPPEAS